MSLRLPSVRVAAFVLACLLGLPFGPARGTEASAAQGPAIEIELNKGELVRLSRAAATVFVADPEIADIQVKSPTLIYVFAKKVGETTLFAVDDRERVLLDAPVTVTHDLTRLNGALRSLLPQSQISARSVEGAVVLTGAVESAVEAENARRLSARFISKDDEVINRLSVVGPNQVNLRVKVAEVSRTVMKQFGINWDSIFEVGGYLYGFGMGSPGLLAAAAAASTGVPRHADNADINNFLISRTKGSLQINALVDALADEGLISVLAEPNLTALSGETASFLAGGEFPIPVPQSGTANNITIEFKKFGVSLAFTPTVLDNGRISLKVAPEVSQLSDVGSVTLGDFVIPALTTRRAETTVELGSGQSFAIAGLLQNNTTNNINKFPGLGDLPVLGALFRSSDFQRDESELVIIVTPYVVRPVSVKMATPTDGLVMPSDAERYLLGRQYSPRPQTGEPAPRGPQGQGLSGPLGFELEEEAR